MASSDAAFNARFRLMDNSKRRSDRSPEKNIAVDFTTADAIAAANWLMSMAEHADQNGTTVRAYRGKGEYDEVPGFTMWGGMWGETGSFAPQRLDASEEVPF